MAERADGCHVTDVDGNAYIDLSCGFGPVLFGHNPSFVTERVMEHLDGRHMALGYEHRLVGENARKLCAFVGQERAAFVITGTEATTLAVRLARLRTGPS